MIKKILFILITLFAFSCDHGNTKSERFLGSWIPTMKGNELIPKELLEGTVLTISKDAHLYFSNYTIVRNGKKIDMYQSIVKVKGTQSELAKKMFTYELSSDGLFLTNVLKPTDVIAFDANNNLVKFPMLFGEVYIWMERIK